MPVPVCSQGLWLQVMGSDWLGLRLVSWGWFCTSFSRHPRTTSSGAVGVSAFGERAAEHPRHRTGGRPRGHGRGEMGYHLSPRMQLSARPANNLAFYLPKVSCCKQPGPQLPEGMEKEGANHSAYQVLPPPTLLPTSQTCAIKHLSKFQIL